jgi:uncharacterized membrane protein YcjF (UPF0283 family)
MDLRNEELPATLQAFELEENQEVFLAEQVVNTQAEITNFTNRYTGKLIKAKTVAPLNDRAGIHSANTVKKPKSSINAVMILVVLTLLALAIYGFSTGWIQDKLNLNI